MAKLTPEMRNSANDLLTTIVEIEKFSNELSPQQELEIKTKGLQLIETQYRKIQHAKELIRDFFEMEDNKGIKAASDTSFAVFESSAKIKDPNFWKNQEAKTLQEIMELPMAFLNRAFQLANKLLHEKRYEDAESIYLFLYYLNPLPSFALGMALSQQASERYEEAIQSYMICLELEPENPLPFLQIATCFYQLKDTPSCVKALDYCIEAAQKLDIQDSLLKEAQDAKEALQFLKAA